MALSARRVRRSDADVFAALASGDERAVERLVADYLPRLTAFAESRGSSDPGGIANATLADFVDRLDRLEFDDPARIRAYLYRSTRNRVIDEYRASRPVELRDESTLEALAGCDDGYEDRIVDRDYLDRLLSGLTDEQREVIELRFGADLSIQETAERTGRTTTGVKAMQRRALRTLRTLVAGLAGAACILLIFWALGRSGSPTATVSEEPAGDPSGNDDVDRGPGRDSGPVDDDRVEEVGSVDGDIPVVLVDERSRSESPSVNPATGSTSPSPTTSTSTSTSTSGPSSTSTSTSSSVPGTTSTSVDLTPAPAPTLGADRAPGADGSVPPSTVQQGGIGEYSCAGISGTAAELVADGWELLIGTFGDDVLDLSDRTGPVFVLGLAGNDRIITGSGDDAVCGGPGSDRIETGGGNDRASGNAGADQIITGPGVDTVWGGPGDDTLYGNDDLDSLDGGDGNDHCDLGEAGGLPVPIHVGCETVVIIQP